MRVKGAEYRLPTSRGLLRRSRPLRLFPVLLVLLAFFSAGAVSDPLPQSEDPHYGRGIEFQKSGRLDEAIKEYELSLQGGPRLEVLGNLGAAFAQQGRYEEAVERYLQALKLAPAQPMILFNLALAYFKSGDLVNAETYFEKSRQADPTNERATILLADCRFQLDRFRDTIALLEPLEQKYPQEMAIAYLLGNAYLKAREMEQGQRQLEKILRNGESPEAHLMMAIAMSGVFRNKEAIAAYQKALELNPRLPMAHVGLATEYLRTSEPEKAMKEYQAELEINPNDYTANFYLGYLHRRNREYDESMKYLEKALRLRPKDGAAMLQLGMVHYLRAELDEAQRVLEEVVQNDPEFIDAHVQLARVYFRKRMMPEGQQAQKTADQLKAKRESARKASAYDPDNLSLDKTPMEGTDARP
jgi:tetratricopeptide (TPR) repeat protein